MTKCVTQYTGNSSLHVEKLLRCILTGVGTVLIQELKGLRVELKVF